MIITFSGLDGSGKTTLIKILEGYFLVNNIKFKSYTIYDDLSIYAFVRKIRRVINSSRNIELNEDLNSKKKSYKLFRSKYVKRFFLLFDIVLVVFVKIYFSFGNKKLILDRYFYDFLMEVTDNINFFQRFICFFFPEPDISFFIETEPEVAFARKGEYDVKTLTYRREIYRNIFRIRPVSHYINNQNLDRSKAELIKIIEDKINIL